jgi:hypothetical protein
LDIGEFHAIAGDAADVRERCRVKPTEPEKLQLINADIIEDDEQDVRPLRCFGRCLSAFATARG